MLSQYKDTGVLYISIKELKLRLGLLDEHNEREKYKNFNMFRKKVLEVAKKELQEKADITFTYDQEKTKNKYTHPTTPPHSPPLHKATLAPFKSSPMRNKTPIHKDKYNEYWLSNFQYHQKLHNQGVLKQYPS